MLTHDERLKLRSKLHTLISLAEIAKSNLMTAEREYEQARDRVNRIRFYARRQHWNTFWFGLVIRGWRCIEVRFCFHEAHSAGWAT